MRDLLRYRFLFEQLVRRELRQKYKGSVLGVAWYLVNPLVLMGAYYLMFGVLFPLGSIDDYPLFLMIGLVVWIFFSQSLLSAAPSLLDQGSLVRKARFPRETIPASVVTVQLATFAIVLALVAVVVVAVRGTLDPALLALPFALALLYAFVLGLGLVVSVLHAYFRDVVPILSAALLPWFFLTPIFFRVQDIDKLAQRDWARVALDWVNPVAPFMRSVRAILYEGALPSAGTLLYIVVAAVVSLGAGTLVFRRMQAELAVVL
jgi:lipopolysaccharide transport system permease protein